MQLKKFYQSSGRLQVITIAAVYFVVLGFLVRAMSLANIPENYADSLNEAFWGLAGGVAADFGLVLLVTIPVLLFIRFSPAKFAHGQGGKLLTGAVLALFAVALVYAGVTGIIPFDFSYLAEHGLKFS